MVAVTEVLVLGGGRRVWWGNGAQGLAAAHWATYQPYLRPRSPPPPGLSTWKCGYLCSAEDSSVGADVTQRAQSERELLELTDDLMGSGLGHQPVFFSKLLK